MPHIGDNIKRLREAKGLSQQELAELVRCSLSAISSWEQGKHAPSRYGKAKLAQVFGVTVKELEGE